MITTSKTLEIRWFEQGEIPSDIYDWFMFNGLGEMKASPETRTDCYFQLPSVENFSLKIREGNLELKVRQKSLGKHCFNQVYEGKLEQWQKWSVDSSVLEKLLYFVPDFWLVSIQKKRWLRCYQTIQLELSQLTTSQGQWWSLAVELEKNTETETVPSFLLNFIQKLFKTFPQKSYRLQTSYAYPKWLQDA